MTREWLLADGLGGYAMGCDDGVRRRKYHGLLLVASPTDEIRWMLVNGVEAWLETDRGPVWLSSHRYAPDVQHPDGATRITSFSADPWPVWSYRVGRGVAIEHEIMVARGHAATLLTWRLVGAAPGGTRLRVRPLMSGRDWHATHRENPAFRFAPATDTHALVWTPYPHVPPTVMRATGAYAHAPEWYRQFVYEEERNRGLEFVEDLASPGVFSWDLTESTPTARLLLTTSGAWGGAGASGTLDLDPHDAAPADAYFATRRGRDTIIAGYPWFTDWGRDTFIALPGLCLASGDLPRMQRILESWCDALSDGMMPNLFPSGSGAPEYNSVDASLWFVVAVRELADHAARRGFEMKARRLTETCEAIVDAYARGARHGIHMDSDGLLAAGAPGVALTWMDAIVDGAPVTPRIGKPVEVQALWINALTFAASWNQKWFAAANRAQASFEVRFRNAARGCLYDVVDVDHVAGRLDDRMRPNQIFACGGLPVALLEGKRAVGILAAVERELWTPMGLRTLAPSDPGYVGRADGEMRRRDRAYHQGTVWPWLTYAFLDARARASGDTSREARAALTAEYLGGLRRHVPTAGVGHVSEIADGDAPHTPRGCPFQAWSLAALLRSKG